MIETKTDKLYPPEFSAGNVRLHHCDCMDFMASKPDGFYDLAIVDPPYGINIMHGGGRKKENAQGGGWAYINRKHWDKTPPPPEYFDELQRISKNQIIWGGNYFVKHLKSSMGWIFWDKMNHKFTTSDGELAFTSFNCKLKVYQRTTGADKGFLNKDGGDIHPTQKSVHLYKWILHNYANDGNKIIDTHGGSFSSAIACYLEGFEFDGCELDEEYYQKACERFDGIIRQERLF